MLRRSSTQLALHELEVGTSLRDELVVGALLDHLPALHDADLVAVLNGAKAMRDQDHRYLAFRDHRIDCRLHLPLGLRVQGAGGLVQQQHLRVADHGAGDGDALLLAAAERGPALAHRGLVALLQGADEAVGVGHARGPHRVLPAGLGAAVQDVGEDGPGEEHGLLLHERHLQPHPAEVQGPDVAPVEQHVSRRRVVVAHQQCDGRALAGAARPDEGRRGARGHLERDGVQGGRLRARGVGEVHAPELHLSA
mmetsp:Transcript_78054/g.221315  ORF Transcript_78054/g.221315 Transcript_78054/m.221315 type:complete len:252 (+) Transcript_78054:287-1042(+)